MEIGMAAGTDREEAFEEGYGKPSELAVQAVCKGTETKGGWNGGKGAYRSTSTEGDTSVCWHCRKTVHTAADCTKGNWNRSLNTADEDKGDISEEVHEDEDELHAWCLLEESGNESKTSKFEEKEEENAEEEEEVET